MNKLRDWKKRSSSFRQLHKVRLFVDSLRLAFLFTLVVFFIMVCSMALVFGVIHFGRREGHFLNPPLQEPYLPLFRFAFFSIILGCFLSIFMSKLPLQPLREVMKAADRIAKGDYSARLSLRGTKELVNLSESFNHMAEELDSMEILHSDFINNFSHEFKTPIVSIRGFARVLKEQNLSEEERQEYLDIIISESERLTQLSSNILNLSKLEKQTTLTETEKETFHLTEQIRLVVSLLSPKWSEKNLELSLDSDEIFFHGNEELLKQVWINLLDNATKFSPEGSFIHIEIASDKRNCFIAFTNPLENPNVSKNFCSHIFTKFYQEDSSHATKGNGLGLTIANRIIHLHQGEITCQINEDDTITFYVSLPIT